MKVLLSDFETFCLKKYFRKYLKQFRTRRFDIIQNLFCLILRNFVSKYILINFSNNSAHKYFDVVQNVILSSPKIPKGDKMC